MCRQRTRSGPESRDRHHGEEPEQGETRQNRLDEVGGHSEEREDPHAHRDAPEHADDVVDRGVVGSLLVTVVEPLEAEEQDPERDREQERHELEPRSDLVGRVAGRWQDEVREDEGKNEAGHVGHEEASLDQRSATEAPAWNRSGRMQRLDGQLVRERARCVGIRTPAADDHAFAHELPRSRRPAPCPAVLPTPCSPPCHSRLLSPAPQRYWFAAKSQVIRRRARPVARVPLGERCGGLVAATHVITLVGDAEGNLPISRT